MFLRLGFWAFLGLLGAKLVCGFFLDFFLCFFILGLVIGFFFVLLFLCLLTLVQGPVLFQLGLDQADDELLLAHVVALQIGFYPLKQAVRYLEGQGSHSLHVFVLLQFKFGVQLVVYRQGDKFAHGHVVGFDVGLDFRVQVRRDLHGDAFHLRHGVHAPLSNFVWPGGAGPPGGSPAPPPGLRGRRTGIR